MSRASESFELVAHRGDRANAPENTLAAFRRACDIACEAIELDVHLTADGQLVVIHDDTLERTTSGAGPVAQQPLAALKQLDAGAWFGPEFAGEPLPTLAEVVELVAGRRTLVVEIKSPPKDTERTEQAVISDLRNGGVLTSSLIISFDWDSVAKVQRLAPQAAVSLLGLDGPELLEAARRQKTGRLSLLHSACTPELMTTVKANSLWINVWTVNDRERMTELVALGIDSLASDCPADMTRWRQELSVHDEGVTVRAARRP